MLKPADWEANLGIVPDWDGRNQTVWVAAPAPRLPWLRIAAARKLLKLDEVEDAAIISQPLSKRFPVTSGIRLDRGPGYRFGEVELRHGKHRVSIRYRRSDEKEFERTYRKILNSAKLVD